MVMQNMLRSLRRIGDDVRPRLDQYRHMQIYCCQFHSSTHAHKDNTADLQEPDSQRVLLRAYACTFMFLLSLDAGGAEVHFVPHMYALVWSTSMYNMRCMIDYLVAGSRPAPRYLQVHLVCSTISWRKIA